MRCQPRYETGSGGSNEHVAGWDCQCGTARPSNDKEIGSLQQRTGLYLREFDGRMVRTGAVGIVEKRAGLGVVDDAVIGDILASKPSLFLREFQKRTGNDKKGPRIAPGPTISIGDVGLRSPCRPCRPCRRRRHPSGERIRDGGLGDHGFGGHQQAGDRSCVLQCRTDNLGRVDDTGLEHVHILFGLGVEAEGLGLVLEDLADHDGAFDAGVLGDLTDRSLESAQDDVDAGLHVRVVGLELADSSLGAQQSHAAAGNDALFNRSAGGVQSVVDAVLLFLHFDFGRAADADHRDAACELGETLLELLTVVVRGGFLDLRLDLRHAALDVLLLRRRRR